MIYDSNWCHYHIYALHQSLFLILSGTTPALDVPNFGIFLNKVHRTESLPLGEPGAARAPMGTRQTRAETLPLGGRVRCTRVRKAPMGTS